MVRDYYVRQLHDWKGCVDVEKAVPVPRSTPASCGARSRGARTLGRPHRDRRRTRQGGAFDRAVGDFAVAYADQNERDYETFAAAVQSGRLEAQTGL